MMQNDYSLAMDRAAMVAELEAAGAKFRGNACTCPYHADRHASAGIFQGDDGHWRFKCQVCDAGGDVYDLQARDNGGKVVAPTKNKPAVAKVFPDIESLKAIMPGKVEDMSFYQYENGDLQQISFRYQTPTGKTFRYARPCKGGFELKAADKPWQLLNLKNISMAQRVVIVEGERKVKALAYFGVIATCSPCGAGKAKHADWQPLKGKAVILWPDNDDTGRAHADDLESLLMPIARVSRLDEAKLSLPVKGDVVDFIKQRQADGKTDDEIRSDIAAVLDAATPCGRPETLGQYIDDCESGKIKVMPLPWPILNDLTLALQPATTTLLCAGPGVSKSFMLLQALSRWIEQTEPVAALMLEEKTRHHILRLLAQRTGETGLTNPQWITGHADQARDYYRKHGDFIARAESIITTTDEPWTFADVIDWITYQAKAGKKLIAIDPVTNAQNITSRRWEEESRFITEANKIAGKYGAAMLMLTHPTKNAMAASVDALAGSSAFGRFSQNVWALAAHDAKSSDITTPCGTTVENHNRTLSIHKARNGRGTGYALAFNFEPDLTLREIGVICKKRK